MDLLLSRYGDMNYIMNLDINDFLGLVDKAIEKERDKNFFAVWKELVPTMTKETFVSFEDYKSQLLRGSVKGKTVDALSNNNLTDEELIEDAENIIKMLKV